MQTKPIMGRLTVAIAIGLFLSTLISSGTDAYVLTPPISINNIVFGINAKRVKVGAEALLLNADLSAIALDRTTDMEIRGYFGHENGTSGNIVDFAEKKGLTYHFLGENLALGYSDQDNLLDAWMASVEHRENILNTNYTSIGLALTETRDGLLIVAIFSDIPPNLLSLEELSVPDSVVRVNNNNWTNLAKTIAQFLQLQD